MTPKQQSAFALDALYCEESIETDVVCADEDRSQICGDDVLFRDDSQWDDSELEMLFIKEKDIRPAFHREIGDEFLLSARRESIEWMMRVKNRYGFTALTGFLAVDYFDRFIASDVFQRDKPWMPQLTAAACLSLAAKVEETHVPLLLDLQVEDAKYVFESKTVKRMELLVLSTLNWRMHPVTPVSFFDHITRRLRFKSNLHWDFLGKCERLLLSIISDTQVMSYLPSITSTAVMLHVIKETSPWKGQEYQHLLFTEMKVNEVEVHRCYELMEESLNPSAPWSPKGVIDSLYSSDSSNESWSAAPFSPSPLQKRKVHDQQMRQPSAKRVVVDDLRRSQHR